MTYLTYIPQPPLSELVDLFWADKGYDPPHAKERVFPSGTMELVVNLLNDEIRVSDRRERDRPRSFRGALICGAHSGHFVIDTTHRASMVGVHFKPGGAFPFLGLPASELRDTNVSLETLWGSKADELRDQLLEAETLREQFRILERVLLAQVEKPPARRPAVAFALEEFGKVPHTRTISQVTDRVGISRRHFIQVFSEEVGLTPKAFCRIRRFQEALRLVESGKRLEWAELALGCGYYDQAHLINEFRTFSGLNPTAYLPYKGGRFSHLPLDDR